LEKKTTKGEKTKVEHILQENKIANFQPEEVMLQMKINVRPFSMSYKNTLLPRKHQS